MLSIYIHIPFCLKKCKYCDFLSFPADVALKKSYYNALCREIASCDIDDSEVETIFFGGGTPSLLSSDMLSEILQEIKNKFNLSNDCEISLECNPGTVTYEKLIGYRDAGINRLSIGLQSCDDEELKSLGRIHNYAQFEECYTFARKAGFENINIDLISAIPGQSLESYKNTLTKVVKFKAEHISAYSLIIEENTEFWDIYGDDDGVSCDFRATNDDINSPKALPDEDSEREMYYLTKRLLFEAGFDRYEISNYSKPGKECRHNTVYWRGGDYISFGLGASSYIDGIRYKNTSDIDEYINMWTDNGKHSLKSYLSLVKAKAVSKALDNNSDKDKGIEAEVDIKIKTYLQYKDAYMLTNDEKMEEYMFLGLRMMSGISISGFMHKFACDMFTIYGKKIEKLVKEGLLIKKEDRLYLTDKGIDVSNYVLSEFLL